MRTLSIDLAGHSYPIHIGAGLLQDPQLLQRYIKGRQVMIVSNERVAKLYLPLLQAALLGYQCDVLLLAEGEQYKMLTTWSTIIDALLAQQHRRSTTLIALGGGVIGDMTGFAAACYQRGVNFIQIPTTLLAQVDASIGGKTAINHAAGKNMIGAFYQPQCVLIDIATLTSLADRELSAGLAEIIKAALIADSDFFGWLEKNIDQLLQRKPAALTYAIEQACAIKANIVMQDPYEQTGLRALLNLGHTFGHAIEHSLSYGQWLHGEAVALGLLLAAKLSQRIGWLTGIEVKRLREILVAAQLPICLPNELECKQLLSAMAIDKKATDAGLPFILLKALGKAVFCPQVSLQDLQVILTDKV